MVSLTFCEGDASRHHIVLSCGRMHAATCRRTRRNLHHPSAYLADIATCCQLLKHHIERALFPPSQRFVRATRPATTFSWGLSGLPHSAFPELCKLFLGAYFSKSLHNLSGGQNCGCNNHPAWKHPNPRNVIVFSYKRW
jgi:hypothetical protein